MATGLPSAETFAKCVKDMEAISRPVIEEGGTFTDSMRKILDGFADPITELLGGPGELHHEPGQTDEEAKEAAKQRILAMGEIMGKIWDTFSKKPQS